MRAIRVVICSVHLDVSGGYKRQPRLTNKPPVVAKRMHVGRPPMVLLRLRLFAEVLHERFEALRTYRGEMQLLEPLQIFDFR